MILNKTKKIPTSSFFNFANSFETSAEIPKPVMLVFTEIKSYLLRSKNSILFKLCLEKSIRKVSEIFYNPKISI